MTMTFDEDLGSLRGLVAEMGGLAEQAIGAALTALSNRDAAAAAHVVDGDARMDAMEDEVQREAVRLIALRASDPDDLRDILAALKIAGLIERIGDYAKNIARRVPALASAGRLEPLSILPAMGRLVSELVREALDAYAARDAEAARAVQGRDRAIDDFHDSLFRTLLTYMMENPQTIGASAHLLFVAKNLERIGDHATGIAETVFFAATGRQLGDRVKGGQPIAGMLQ
jgi:phosphate transport system protein